MHESYAKLLTKILGRNVIKDKHGHALFADWIELAKNPLKWKSIGMAWILEQRQKSREHGNNHLLGRPIKLSIDEKELLDFDQ